jgi:hypothetical protein
MALAPSASTLDGDQIPPTGPAINAAIATTRNSLDTQIGMDFTVVISHRVTGNRAAVARSPHSPDQSVIGPHAHLRRHLFCA